MWSSRSRRWAHSGFNIDDSVRIACGDTAGMQRLTAYIARCPFSLARMAKVTPDGKVIYRTGKSKGLRFPVPCDEWLKPGASRNFQVFEPLEFLAEVTQHIPDKGQHQVHYFGYYSNKSRGVRQRMGQVELHPPVCCSNAPEREQDTEYCRKRRKTWAALNQCVYEVDPLKCTRCGGTKCDRKNLPWCSKSRRPMMDSSIVLDLLSMLLQ